MLMESILRVRILKSTILSQANPRARQQLWRKTQVCIVRTYVLMERDSGRLSEEEVIHVSWNIIGCFR